MYSTATRITLCTLSGAALMLACGGEKSDGDKSGAAKAGKSTGKATAKKPLAELFTGKTVTLVGPLAKLQLGTTEDEAKKAAPELFADAIGLKSEEFEGVTFSPYVDSRSKKVESVSVFLPKGQGEGAISGAWGPGVKVKLGGLDEVLAWWNPQAKLRATLKGDILSIGPYMTLPEFLGDGADGFAFEKPQAVIGATPEQLTAAYGTAFDNANDTIAYISMPALKYGKGRTRVSLTKRDGKVERMQIWLTYGPEKDDIKKTIETKFGGPAKEIEEGVAPYTKKRLMLSDMVEIKDQKDKWYLEVAAPKEPKTKK